LNAANTNQGLSGVGVELGWPRLDAFLRLKPMPTTRITMRRIRDTLRLHLQARLSYNEIGRTVKISKSAVSLTALMEPPMIARNGAS